MAGRADINDIAAVRAAVVTSRKPGQTGRYFIEGYALACRAVFGREQADRDQPVIWCLFSTTQQLQAKEIHIGNLVYMQQDAVAAAVA